MVDSAQRQPNKLMRCLVIAVFCALVFGLVFSKGMIDGINHDEHQFLAPAALLQHTGLKPYRDFPLFHLPVLTLAYAPFYKCEHPLLMARLFNILCASAAVWLVFGLAWRRFATWPFWRRVGVAAGFASLLLFSPLFVETTGRTWNHDLSVLLMLAAVWLHLIAAESLANIRQTALIAASGLCIGLAVGTRLTCAPLTAPFLLGILFFPGHSLRRKIVLGAVFSVGVLIALAPAFWAYLAAPQQFLFGNFEFPRLRLLDVTDTRAQKTVKLWRKVRYFFKEIGVSNLAIFGLFFFAAVPGLYRNLRTRATRDFGSLFFVLLIPFVLFGCFAPTRYQYQHFYIVAPLFILAAVQVFPTQPWTRLRALVFTALCLFAVIAGASGYRAVMKISNSENWTPMQCHRVGMKIRELAGSGKVMTYAPIYPLEAGMEIYPEFATGPFATRLAHLVTPERRKAMHLVSRDDLPAFLRADPPAAILLGFEPPDLEDPLREFAQQSAYRLAYKRKTIELWIPAKP